jgi:prepilin-type N-terminal cleavage/methylation domain-containing protein
MNSHLRLTLSTIKMDQTHLIAMNDNLKALINIGRQRSGCRNKSGYTLIELIVVIALLGIMIGFSVPRLHDMLYLDETRKASRWIIGKVHALREAAVQKQKTYVLHIDMDTNQIWDTEESMSEENRDEAALNAQALPGDVEIIDVEFPIAGKVSSGRADITFYKSGYSDKAMIHMQDDDEQMSFLIEPFLTKIRLFDKYASFDD